jgi:tetratricopeptide (TPR) repeat protein
MSKSKSDRVFLSYAHEDLDKVNEVYEGMKKRGLNVWFDKVHMKPGTWKTQIEKAITRSRFFVICLSNAALMKTGDEKPGFQDKELNRAYNIAQDQSDQDFTIVPVRLEDCGRGDTRLSSFQQYDLFNDFETGLDMLAVHLGGHSLSDAKATDERTEDEKMVDSLMGKADVAYYAADYDKALKVLNSILVLEPGNKEALNNLGLAWYEKGEYDKAIEYCDKALKSDLNTFGEDHPNVAAYRNNLGSAWHAKGEYDRAIEYLEKALSVFRMRLGNDHPYTIKVKTSLDLVKKETRK